MAWDEDKYKKIFEQRYGKGSFDSGLSDARSIGRSKANAAYQKQLYQQRLKEQEKAQKAADEGSKYNNIFGGTKSNANASKQLDDMIKNPGKKGAYRNSEDIRNDPSLQAELKRRGYTTQKFIDAMYNGASKGQFKSERAYKQFSGELGKETKAANKAADTKSMNEHGMNVQDWYDFNKKQHQENPNSSSKSSDKSFLSKAWDGLKKSEMDKLDSFKKSEIGQAGKAALEFFNPFDNVSAKDAVNKYLNHKQSDTFKEVSRGANRAVDSASLGAMSNLDKKLNKREPYYTSQRKLGEGGGTDMITSGLGYLVPGIGEYKALNSLKAGKALTEFGSKSLGKKLLSESAKGATIGAGISVPEVAIREGLNPDDYTATDNLKYIGQNIALGAIAEPALYGAGKAIGKGFEAASNKSMQGLLPDKEDAAKALSDIIKKYHQEQSPLPGKPDARKASELLPNGNDITSPNFASKLKTQNDSLNIPKMGKTINELPPLEEVSMLDRANMLDNTDRKLPDFSYGKQTIEKGNPVNVYGAEIHFDKVEHAPSSYWRKRYEDFADKVNKNYDTNNLSKEALDDLWTQFAHKDEPVTLDQVVELAYPKEKSVLNTNDVWDKMGNKSPLTNNLKKVVKNAEKSQPKQSLDISPLPKATKSGNDNLLLSLKSVTGEPPLKTVKTTKAINKMNKDELKTVYKQLEEKLSNSGDKKSVQDDMKRVNDLLMRMNLQQFSETRIPASELPDTKSHIGAKTDKKKLNIRNTIDNGYTKTVDNLHRLDQFDKQVEKVLGRKLKASEETHTLGLNSRGSDQISKQILTEKMVDKNGEVVGDSLKDITMKIPKGKLKDFEDYLVNKHAVTRMERGEKVFPDEMQMTPDKSRAKVTNYEEKHPEFKNLAKQYYNYNKQLGQKWLVDTGILSKEQWEGYLKANPHYVPNNRIFSDLERPAFGNNAKKGFANQTNPVKKATGSQRKIVSPIESTIEHTAQYVKTAKRNEVMQTLINNIKQNPKAFKDWAEIVKTDKTPESILETLQKEGVDGVLENINKGFEQKPDLTKGNIVRGLIDGQPVHVKVQDPALLDAITNLQPKAQNVVINALGQVTRVMKNLTTGINPVFSLTRNIWRDIPTAYANSKSTNNPVVFSKDLVQAVVSVMKNDKLYKSFKAVGGGHSSPISSDVNLLAQSKRSILPREKGALNGAKHLGGKALGALENLNNAVEAAPRLAEFKRLSKNGDYNSKMKALYESNDVTVNFNKYGNVAKEVDAIIPYFNAAVQGLDKTWRVLASPKASTAQKVTAGVKAFMAVTLPSVALYAVNHNNPNYKKLSNFIKDSNFLIPKGDGTFYKIPKPRELGVLFGSDVERTLRAWNDKDPKAFKDFGTYMFEMFSLPTRTIAAPFSDIRSNKNFMGAPIVPGDLKGLSPKYQYDAQTSEPAKKIGGALNISPKNIDYLIKSYGGVLGELGIPATTKNSTIGETLKQKVTADPVFSNDIQRDFYDTKTKLDQAHNDFAKQGIQSKDMNEALRKIFNQKSLQMGKIRKMSKEVQNDPNLSAKEKRDRMRQLQEMINQLAESGNQLKR